jgi:uncharacterized protein YkwD
VSVASGCQRLRVAPRAGAGGCGSRRARVPAAAGRAARSCGYAWGMRFALLGGVVLACAGLACGPGLNDSNGAKLGEALAFAAAAGAAQVAQAAAEQHARNTAPVAVSSTTGVSVSPDCDNDGQYGCLSLMASPSAGDAPEPEMGDDEARDYVLGYLNGVRRLNRDGPLVRDEALDAFAQAGSDELAQDYRPNQHMIEHAREVPAALGELQGSPDGSSPGPLQDRLAETLLRFTGEGPGGMHHDAMLRPEWRKLGVGVAHREGRVYFTVDLSR